MKLLNYNKVLCLSPHPDDVEYGMLGTICKYKDTQFDVLTLSVGGEYDKSNDSIRQKECEMVWKHIDNLNGSFFELDYIKNITEDELIYKITEKIDLSKYDVLFVPSLKDGHQDHRKISEISAALIRKYPCGIIEYRTPSVMEEWIPNFFVDINVTENRNKSNEHSQKTSLLFKAGIWYIKLNKLKLFKSQQSKTYFGKDSIKSFHSNYQCSNKNKNIVESFKIVRTYN